MQEYFVLWTQSVETKNITGTASTIQVTFASSKAGVSFSLLKLEQIGQGSFVEMFELSKESKYVLKKYKGSSGSFFQLFSTEYQTNRVIQSINTEYNEYY
jgi:hypothetical protein